MPSITLSNLAWATPGGHVLFSGLDLAFGRERTGLVGRNGVGKSTLIRLIAGEIAPRTGTVAVDGTVSVLRQAVQVGADETVADLFGVTAALATLRRAEAGEASLDEFADVDWTLDERIAAALARVGLDAEADARLATLSGGQRTRAALAAAIFPEPDFLLLDEPTNNLDREGREAVVTLLAGWRSGAIVVSHDRELLGHMDAIVELTSLGATRYGGNWDAYRERKAVELDAARHDLAHAEKTADEVSRRIQVAVERRDRRSAAGARKGASGSMPKILAGARKRRAEATAGKGTNLAARQRGEAEAAVASAQARVEILERLALTLPATGLAAGRTVLDLRGVTAGYDPAHPLIRDLTFAMVGPERVAVSGPNGSGKTTLLKVIAGEMAPLGGTVSVPVPFAMLDQRVSLLDPAESIRDNFLRLNPGATENACRATLAAFLFRADAALQVVGTLSGGQTLRAGLACVLGGPRPPQLLILDEPTNHLDIDSIEAVEAGLSAYDGALLVVSHDESFLANVGVTRRLALGPEGAVSTQI
jgi:ATPase subunit of ABC transporter with duplicated ATPase domains